MSLRFTTKNGLRSFRIAFTLLGWIAIGVVSLVATITEPTRAERLPVKGYTVADGLLRDAVIKVRQDSRGFLWFCTAEGFSRFDGVSMTNFTVADGLPDRMANDFLETRNGTIYLATRSGLARLNRYGLRGSASNPLFTVLLPPNPKAKQIFSLFEDRSGRVLAGTSYGLFELIETGGNVEFRPLLLGTESEPVVPTALLEDQRGTLWIGTDRLGLFRWSSDGKLTRFTTANQLTGNSVTSLLEDRSGRLWVGIHGLTEGGVCRLEAADSTAPVRRCYRQADGLSANWVLALEATHDGRIWVGTVSGVSELTGDGNEPVVKTYDSQHGLCERTDSLLEDKDGNLWAGTECGAKRIARYGFTTYYVADGLDHVRINSLFLNSGHELFVSTQTGKRAISRFDGHKFSLYRPRVPADLTYWGWGWNQTVWQDRAGAWWIPVGLALFRSPDNTPFENLATTTLQRVSLPSTGGEIFRLFEDSRGDIWLAMLGNTSELWRWERASGTWHDHTQAVKFTASNRVGTAFVEDRAGNLWIGASSDSPDSALIRYRNGDFRVWDIAAGAPSGWLHNLFVDSRGRLWITSTQDGLWRLDDTTGDQLQFVKYTVGQGLSSNSVASITEDAYGRMYAGTWRGLDRLDPDTGVVEHFATSDGLPDNYVPCSIRDRNNNLWFGTPRGLARFVPEPKRDRVPPTMLIMGFRAAGQPQSVSIMGETEVAPLSLSSGQRQLTINYLGLGATLGEPLSYEYRFGTGAWTATSERTLDFPNLASGTYRFEVRAKTADGIYSRPATVSVVIAAPIWQRWWFLALMAVIVAGIVFLIYRYRVRRLVELEKVRTRIATDLHDDIGANLTRISLLSEVARQKAQNGSGELLSSIADIARESVSSMNDIVWAISPEHDTLLDLTRRMRRHATEVFALRDIELEFEAPPPETDVKLSISMRRDLLLIFKEAVNNVLKHSNCSRVEVRLALKASTLELRVRDNGKGFTAGLESDGQGLRSMSRRAQVLGGKFRVESTPGAGTLVELALPLSTTGVI